MHASALVADLRRVWGSVEDGMPSNNRARTRAIRAEMVASGENYTRAAHTAATRSAGNLRAVCFTCREDIPPGGGVIHISHHEVDQVLQARAAVRERQAAKAAAEGRTGLAAQVLTLNELLEGPEDARWQVHCDACNPHRDEGCAGCYWFGIQRCSTWAQLVEWTVHLSEKDWVHAATNWMQFIRGAAHGHSEVGLICHPADRYKDAPEH